MKKGLNWTECTGPVTGFSVSTKKVGVGGKQWGGVVSDKKADTHSGIGFRFYYNEGKNNIH